MDDMKRLITLCEGQADLDDIAESAPPGKKAERFIKRNKKDFKKRYGKKWGSYLYGTAWKQFGEGATFRDYLSLQEAIIQDQAEA